ncbi:MAG TPA: hypothetical protein VEF90_16520 [Xanthobacteraceae bacterium]|nr:hypothetical protein [Xanthobacteraceae bacterium]
MNFVYPRRVSVYRLPGFESGNAGYGAQDYQEAQTASAGSIWSSTPVYTGLQCSIQEYRSGQRPIDDLPGSTTVTPTVKLYIPRMVLAKGSLMFRDYLLDDLGVKYHVINPYWNSLGYRAYCVFLET